ncbi:MAG: hypothetical protein ACREPA_07515, partial [Candidatus Dormibacteraceae bacterium]
MRPPTRLAPVLALILAATAMCAGLPGLPAPIAGAAAAPPRHHPRIAAHWRLPRHAPAAPRGTAGRGETVERRLRPRWASRYPA